MTGLLDGFNDRSKIPAFVRNDRLMVGLAISEILGTTQTTDVIWQYTAEEQAAILEIYDKDEDCTKAFIKVELTGRSPLTGKVGKKVVQHWANVAKSKIPPDMSIWAFLSPIARDDLAAHIAKPNCIVGIVPFRLGLVAVDIDKQEIEAVQAVNDTLGDPISTFPTASDGWHSLFPVDTFDTAKIIKASGYLIDGVHYGEMCCLHRFANCWSPINWLKAMNKRLAMKESDDGFITSDIINDKIVFMGKEKRERKPRDPNAPPTIGNPSNFDALVKHLGLTMSDTGEYQGHCPICDPDKSGGGTRFKAKQGPDNRVLLNCFACAPNGFDDADYGRIMRSVSDTIPTANITAFLKTRMTDNA